MDPISQMLCGINAFTVGFWKNRRFDPGECQLEASSKLAARLQKIVEMK